MCLIIKIKFTNMRECISIFALIDDQMRMIQTHMIVKKVYINSIANSKKLRNYKKSEFIKPL